MDPSRAPTLTLGDIVQKSADYLRDRGVDTPRLDAELLLAHVLGCDRLKLYLSWDREMNADDMALMRDMLRRRGREREPVARIVGQREFYGRPFRVEKATFVPRPETEWLVERAERFLAERDKAPGAVESRAPRVIDIGTGTGCVAISIALQCPKASVCATDLSDDALRIARDNASLLGAAARVRFQRGDLFADLDGPFDLVVSNPPYVARSVIEGLAPEVAAHDPRAALDGGESGLDLYERLIREAAPRMRPEAMLLLEIGEGQGDAVAAMLRAAGMEAAGPGAAFRSIRVERDLAGLERYVEAARSEVEIALPKKPESGEAGKTEDAGDADDANGSDNPDPSSKAGAPPVAGALGEALS